jgi:hypothetical protein
MAWVQRTLVVLFGMTIMSACNISFVERSSYYVPFRRFLGNVRREFMHRLSVGLHHGTLGSCLRDALQEGSADAVACLPVRRA